MRKITPINPEAVAQRVIRCLPEMISQISAGEREVAWVLSRETLKNGTVVEVQLVTLNRSAESHG